MATHDLPRSTGRRGFLGLLATGAASLGLPTLLPLKTFAEKNEAPAPDDPDAWFAQLKGKHKVVYDSPHPNGIFPFAWPKVFLMTNAATGTPEKDCNVVVVLRHDSIAYAFDDRIWEKYQLGEHFNVKNPAGNIITKHPFWKPAPGTYSVPGIGPVQIGIDELQANGVKFCVCEAATTVNTAVVAKKLNADPAEVKKDWMSGLLPGIQPVPSGVWALGRAQEKGCAYIYAG